MDPAAQASAQLGQADTVRDADNGGVSPAQLKLYNLLRFPSLPLLPDPVCAYLYELLYSTFVKPNIPYGQSYAKLPVISSHFCHPGIRVIRMITFNVVDKPTNRRTNNIWGYRFALQTMPRLYWVVQCAGTVSIMQPLLSIMTNGRGN